MDDGAKVCGDCDGLGREVWTRREGWLPAYQNQTEADWSRVRACPTCMGFGGYRYRESDGLRIPEHCGKRA
jgi:hypothetical protein